MLLPYADTALMIMYCVPVVLAGSENECSCQPLEERYLRTESIKVAFSRVGWSFTYSKTLSW